MELVRALILGVVQGATEFVPVSSSAHLVLVPWLLGWEDPGLLFDTMVHWGTLLGAVAYFWSDIVTLVRAWLQSLAQRRMATPQARLAWLIIVGTVPGALMGFLWEDFFEELFKAPAAVAALLLVTGVILVAAERVGPRTKGLEGLTLLGALFIGLAQGIAIAPGISRSGATIGAGLLLGLRRAVAARYSFLLSLPIILGAGLTQLGKAFPGEGAGSELAFMGAGFLAAAVSGYLCIRFLLAFLQHHRLYVFAGYCWVLGLASLFLALRP